jgi:aconitate hydratase
VEPRRERQEGEELVASPESVVVAALSGSLLFDPTKDTLANDKGEAVTLPAPKGDELPERGFAVEDAGVISSEPDASVEVVIDPKSDRLQKLAPFAAWNGEDIGGARVLIKVKGKCTTDHISEAGKWLKYRGHLENISGNLLIGAINSVNGKPNEVKNLVTGAYGPVPEAAKAYREAGTGSVVVGDENYGEGSSREHAAMEPRFLGVKAVLVKSFARIHETNLKKQGMLALTFANPTDWEKIREDDLIDIQGLVEFAPGKPLTVVARHADGTSDSIPANHTYNQQQIGWFKAGSALNAMVK